MKMMIVGRILANILLPLAALFAAEVSCAQQQARLGTWKTPQTIQPYFYDRFLPPALRAQVFSFTNPADQKTALLAGSLDMCGTTIAHAIHSASQGQPVVLVAAMCNKCSALVVRKDGPVAEVADLKGRRIGYVPGTMHEILLRETLARHGLKPERDVRLTRIDFFDMGTALARGGIDAFLSGEPFPALAVGEGYGRILSYPYYEESIGTMNAGMLVARRSIVENPQLVKELVLAHARASEHLKAHPQEWIQRAAEFGTRPEILQSALPNMELAWRMDEMYLAQAKALGERMQALGLIQHQPDYASLFDLTFVRLAAETIGP